MRSWSQLPGDSYRVTSRRSGEFSSYFSTCSQTPLLLLQTAATTVTTTITSRYQYTSLIHTFYETLQPLLLGTAQQGARGSLQHTTTCHHERWDGAAEASVNAFKVFLRSSQASRSESKLQTQKTTAWLLLPGKMLKAFALCLAAFPATPSNMRQRKLAHRIFSSLEISFSRRDRRALHLSYSFKFPPPLFPKLVMAPHFKYP